MRYEAPTSVEDAVALLANGTDDVRVLAGGTDLLVQLRAGVIAPELVVDIKNIRETREITPEDGGYRLGAAASGAELGEQYAAASANTEGAGKACQSLRSSFWASTLPAPNQNGSPETRTATRRPRRANSRSIPSAKGTGHSTVPVPASPSRARCRGGPMITWAPASA